jgi:hypothetical protein
MDPGTRRAIAYIAGCSCAGAEADGILDLETGEHAEIEGRVGDEIAVYDHSRNCLVGGPVSQLFDGGTQNWVNLRISGEAFSGFEHKTNHYFGGRSAGHDVWLFDSGADRWFEYSLSGMRAANR